MSTPYREAVSFNGWHVKRAGMDCSSRVLAYHRMVLALEIGWLNLCLSFLGRSVPLSASLCQRPPLPMENSMHSAFMNSGRAPQ
jgi:hypothetical protein